MKRILLTLTSLAFANLLSAAPVVSYTATGSSGDYMLDFSVTNNLNAGQDIYFFGVELSARDIVGSPTGFDPNAWNTWTVGLTSHNNTWLSSPYSGIEVGETQSGFIVHVT